MWRNGHRPPLCFFQRSPLLGPQLQCSKGVSASFKALTPGHGSLAELCSGPRRTSVCRRGGPPPRSRPSRNDSMTISPPERGSDAKSQVEKVDNPATFELFGKPGHFDRALAKGPKTTTWVWNLHANAHDFDAHTSDLQAVSQRIF